MCTSKIDDNRRSFYSNDYRVGGVGVGRINSNIDPGGAYVNTGDEDKLDPVHLRVKTPDIPAVPATQDAKEPDAVLLKRKGGGQRSTQGGTLLTGPRGVAGGSLNTGSTTLLGG